MQAWMRGMQAMGVAGAMWSVAWAAPASAQAPGSPASAASPDLSTSAAPVAHMPSPPHSAPENAALAYHLAWMLESAEARENLDKSVRTDDPLWRPGEQLKQNLIDSQESIKQLLRAAAAPRCDFGIDFADGDETLLPYLAKMRDSAKLLYADATRLYAAGDSTSAAERVAALYALARHAIDGRTLIGSLVALTICDTANRAVEHMAEHGMSAAARDRILASMEKMDASDLFGIRATITGEKTVTTEWIRHRFTGPTAGKDLAVAMSRMDNATADQMTQLARLDERAIDAQLDELNKLYDQLAAAWDRPDFIVRQEDLRAQVNDGRHGLLAQVLFPSLSKTYQRSLRAQADFRAMLTTVRSVRIKDDGGPDGIVIPAADAAPVEGKP